MSFMDKIKEFFSGGSTGESDHDHAGHDDAAHPHTPEAPPPMPPAEPTGMAAPPAAPSMGSTPEPLPDEPERRDDL